MLVMRRIAVAVMFAASVAVVVGQEFKPKSDLPPQLRSIAADHPIDTTCDDMAGSASSDPGKLQNDAKNNFYIAGDAVTITYNTFIKLMRVAEDQGIPHGSDKAIPRDRSILKDVLSDRGVSLGEGTLVRFVGQLIEARHSNVGKGETVNCGEKTEDENDIHVDLGQRNTDDACLSVTAEISPHFRPDAWDSLAGADFGNRPLRFTGPLLFDASHTPCKPGKQISPKRASIWEIHPVYAIDVCQFRAMSRCSASDESAWTPLHEWVGQHTTD